MPRKRKIIPEVSKPSYRDHLIACALNVGIPTSEASGLTDDAIHARICAELDVPAGPLQEVSAP